MKYRVYGTKELTIEVEADTPNAAAAVIGEQGFRPVCVEQIDEEVFTSSWDCIGKCEACGKQLVDGDKYVSFLDGPIICAEHE